MNKKWVFHAWYENQEIIKKTGLKIKLEKFEPNYIWIILSAINNPCVQLCRVVLYIMLSMPDFELH